MSASRRVRDIAPFHVMELMKAAQRLEAQGHSIIHMEVGEPDFPTPAPILEAAQRYLVSGHVHYTDALGLPALREAIAQYYLDRYGVPVPPHRILVTTGASAALLMALAALIDPGDEILVPDPGYPCNRHFTRLFEGKIRPVPVSSEKDFQPTAEQIKAYWGSSTRALILASPANPTGTMIEPAELSAISEAVSSLGGTLIVDEIYHGLTYDRPAPTAVGLSPDNIVINSFSKYFGMTGWRLGWMVVPENLVREVEKLAQNMYISPPATAQFAALAAFHPHTMEILEERRWAFRDRRDALVSGLESVGIAVPVRPHGAFYVYGDVSRLGADSFDFAQRLIQEAHVAATPGIDFGQNQAHQYMRFACTVETAKLEEGIRRIRRLIG